MPSNLTFGGSFARFFCVIFCWLDFGISQYLIFWVFGGFWLSGWGRFGSPTRSNRKESFRISLPLSLLAKASLVKEKEGKSGLYQSKPHPFCYGKHVCLVNFVGFGLAMPPLDKHHFHEESGRAGFQDALGNMCYKGPANDPIDKSLINKRPANELINKYAPQATAFM